VIDTLIILKDLPKVSLNKWYAGCHWTKRKKLKDTYTLMVKSQFKGVFSKDKQYDVRYDFNFDKRPLDASNCVAMVKMIEDIIFEDDSYKIVKKITITSSKSKENIILVKIKEL
jgi:hypothetical protein